MSRFLVSFALFSMMAAPAQAYVQEVPALDVTREMAQWNRDFGQRSAERVRELGLDTQKEGYTECAAVTEIQGAYICASYDQINMNQALGRASFFVEGLDGTPAGTVVKANSPAVVRYNSMIGGHDLRSEDLMRFWQAVERACKKDTTYCATSFELDLFETFIVPKAAERADFVVITYASRSRMRYTDVVTHEIMHAQYFLQDDFRRIVDKFWQEQVSEEDKVEIRGTLSSVYDSTNELLMINEFQAYILMAGAERNMLGSFVDTYREELMSVLTAEGIEPVQVR